MLKSVSHLKQSEKSLVTWVTEIVTSYKSMSIYTEARLSFGIFFQGDCGEVI